MKIKIIAVAGVILIAIGMTLQMIQYQKEINDLNERLDNALIEIDRLEAENESLWDNYYMNVTNQEGYEYFE